VEALSGNGRSTRSVSEIDLREVGFVDHRRLLASCTSPSKTRLEFVSQYGSNAQRCQERFGLRSLTPLL
jgi:hypothetical protein